MKKSLNVDDCKKIIYYITEKITENKTFLTEVDSAIGDGDHGIGMVGGLQKASEAVSKLDNVDDVYEVFKAAGKAMLMSMGGASGVIFGSMFLAGAKDTAAKKELGTTELSDLFADGLAAIKLRGKAKVGDKTMVDALEPAVIAMQNYSGSSISEMLNCAMDASFKGMESTKDMIAVFGRAKSLMERAIGHQDAGATSVWIIFRSMYDWVCENEGARI